MAKAMSGCGAGGILGDEMTTIRELLTIRKDGRIIIDIDKGSIKVFEEFDVK